LCAGKLAPVLPADELARYARAREKLSACVGFFEAGDFAGVARLIVEVADEANAYVAENAPWLLAKDETKRDRLHIVCSLALNYFRLLSVYLTPIVPAIATKALALFNETSARFDAIGVPLLGAQTNEFSALATRIDPKQIEAMIEASK